MLDKYLRPTVIQWLKTPHKPEVIPDAVPEPALVLEAAPGVLAVPASSTEDALVPSVLGTGEEIQ